jgi:GDP-D-mannose dehydratase
MMKKALIIGVTGQDRSYIAELLLEKRYETFRILKENGFKLPTLKETNE